MWCLCGHVKGKLGGDHSVFPFLCGFQGRHSHQACVSSTLSLWSPLLLSFFCIFVCEGTCVRTCVCAQVYVCMACAYRRPKRSSKSTRLPGIGVCKSPRGAGTRTLALSRAESFLPLGCLSGLPLWNISDSGRQEGDWLPVLRLLENSSLVFCMCWWCLLSRD